MKVLLIVDPLYPIPGNNAVLLCKAISQLRKKYEFRILSCAFGQDESKLPNQYDGIPIYWELDQKRDFIRNFIYPILANIEDYGGNSDAISVLLLYRKLRAVLKDYKPEAIISISEPHAMSVVAAKAKGVKKKILYLMDPPNKVIGSFETKYKNRTLKWSLNCNDLVLTTPFIREKLIDMALISSAEKVTAVGFPIITQTFSNHCSSKTKIKLLFCGWLYSKIRSPKYFLDIVNELSDKYEVIFMGKECDCLKERFTIKSEASIITLPQQSYEVALQAMADADVLINIGNSIPVHMPSKTLEYINTGKPIVNFYKIQDCPTLYYTARYPLALNLYEGDRDIDKVKSLFTDFCESTKGQYVDRKYILEEYKDCTPEYIANKILDVLEDQSV